MSSPAPQRKVMNARVAILMLVVVGLLFTSIYPLRRYIAVRHEITALHKESALLDQRTAELEKQKNLLTTDAEVERLAREHLGWVRPGEVPFVVASPPTTLDPAPAVKEAAAAPHGSLFGRWLAAVGRALGAVR